MELVTVDIGGTHARFAIAEVAEGRVLAVGKPVTQAVADHATFEAAWQGYVAALDRPVPRAAALSIAAPINDALINLTNSPWILRPAELPGQLGVDALTLINDFGAIGHAVAQLSPDDFHHLCGPDRPLPDHGSITICGPGTGLGVAQLFREPARYHVIPCEGGHIAYAPLDEFEDVLVRRLRADHGRVSCERVASGPGIVAIYQALAELNGVPPEPHSDKALWDLALSGKDKLAVAALERFCLALGAVAGDYALAHGPTAVVIAGGLGYRLRDILAASGFAERFVAKGRFETLMRGTPVKLITYPEPGLYGAAAAFAQEHI